MRRRKPNGILAALEIRALASSSKHSGWARKTRSRSRRAGCRQRSAPAECASHSSAGAAEEPVAGCGRRRRRARSAGRRARWFASQSASSFAERFARLRMLAAAVGAFHNQVVDRRQGFGIADDGQPRTADVARESEPHLACRSARSTTTEDMAGVVRLHRQSAPPMSVGVR